MERNWFAVLRDRDDNDWGTGSFDWEEAVAMAKRFGDDSVIAEIDGMYNEYGEAFADPICVAEFFIGEDF